jgi:6-pyruvoyltetrahydropterin/6-carboxytetrahydropterin synthase
MIRLTRRLTFSAAHADWLFALSRAENVARFGPHADPEPHGHNFVLEVTIGGEIDLKLGIVVNIKDIDRIVKTYILQILDRKFINRQVPAFCEQPVTSENLLTFIAAELKPHLPAVATLLGLRLEETPLQWVEWQASPENDLAKESGPMQLTRVYEFAASHRLHSPHLSDEENRELFGKCNYPHGHGHNYLLEVTVAGPTDPHSGRVIDPDVLDAIVLREIVDRYDHRHLNYDIPELEGLIPSTEVVTKAIWQRLHDQIPAPARLRRIVVRETARNFFEYQGEDEPVE